MTHANRLEKLRGILNERGLDGILISQPQNRRYLSGFDGSAGYLLITPRASVLATDFRYWDQAKEQAPDYEIFPAKGEMTEWLPRLMDGHGLKRLGFEAGHVSFSLYRRLSDILKETALKLNPLDGIVEGLRAVKDPKEIELITQAAAISDAAMEHAGEIIRSGMTERELGWAIERFMREEGSEALPFEVIVASGPNAALPHAKPSSRAIGKGEPVVIDIGARVGGYASDLTRTLCVGSSDKQFNRIYSTVLGAQLGALALIKAGMTGEEADRMAREIITEAGLGDTFGHSLGHGIGLVAHELPRLGPGSTEVLENGMVFTIEPGVYLEGWGGVRIEDTVVMENDRIKIISKSRKVRK